MSQTAITLAFEQWKASQAITGEPVLLDEFVFANVPGLDASKPIDRNETLPPAAQIVHRQAVSRKGVVNENAVVHSVVLGADVGDFSFNWVGLINKASNTLAMIVHAPVQQKLKTKDGQQGNVLTRSFLMEYNGAQAETQINTPAETWQIDFTARMAGIDERQRLENIDLYGAAAFLGNGWLVAKSGSQFYVTAGVGYVRGLRAQLAANQNITVTTKPVKVWLDVAWTGTLASAWGVVSKITLAADLTDYVQNGVQHYVFAVASIDANGVITDLRPKGTLDDQAASDALKKHEQSRNHPDATTQAKGFTQLSSATDSNSEALSATPKAVKAVRDELIEVKNTLGTASGNDVVTSKTDNTEGRLPVVGWMGLGSVAQRTAVAPSNSYDEIPTGLPSGFWTHVVSGGPYAYSVALQQDGGGAKNTRHLIIPADANGKIAMRWDEGSTFRYQYFYTDKNKPNADDVGALALTGGKMAANGAITGSLSGSGAYAAQNDSGNLAPFFQLINDTATSKFFPIIKQRYTQGGGTWALGTIIGAGNFQLFYLSNSDQTGKLFTFDKSGQFLPSSYSNFDARYQAKGNYTPAGQAYTKAESDGRFQPKGNYTPAGQAYTKAESDARYNIKNTASKAANGWWQCGSTGIIEQWCQGATMTSETTQAITFPKAFPNACLAISVSTLNVNNSVNTEGMFQLVSKTNTGCVVMANRAYGSIGQVAVLIRAVGY